MMIFMPVNEYGFCVNIRDPRIRTRYEEYKTKNNIPLHFPCSDKQRLDFEREIKEEFFEKYPEHYARIRKYIQGEGEKHSRSLYHEKGRKFREY